MFGRKQSNEKGGRFDSHEKWMPEKERIKQLWRKNPRKMGSKVAEKTLMGKDMQSQMESAAGSKQGTRHRDQLNIKNTGTEQGSVNPKRIDTLVNQVVMQ